MGIDIGNVHLTTEKKFFTPEGCLLSLVICDNRNEGKNFAAAKKSISRRMLPLGS